MNPGFGAGRAASGGRGRRNRFFAKGLPRWQRAWVTPSAEPLTRDEELNALKEQARYFEQGLTELQARVDALHSEGKSE